MLIIITTLFLFRFDGSYFKRYLRKIKYLGFVLYQSNSNQILINDIAIYNSYLERLFIDEYLN
ncbi:hypothetical protein B1J93_08975 [Leptospira kirschneri serovar Pomona]|uniref:Uncharacterized protein n=1 Tax=Leptospira kirschneri serovar Pomona TaxID=561005 RepID=A0A1T1DPW8_9LEPT|nr:hypothetical protein B1J93_08975 [Leptospira kirschneri serovar Pomona]